MPSAAPNEEPKLRLPLLLSRLILCSAVDVSDVGSAGTLSALVMVEWTGVEGVNRC